MVEEIDWRMRVFDSLTFPTLILKPNHSILNVNKRFLEKFNVSIDEIIGKKCHQILSDSEKTCSEKTCPLSKVFEEKRGQSILKRIIHENEIRFEDRVFSPILNDHGNVAYIIESIRDVTRIKYLEKELSDVKELMERVVQSSVSAIVAASREGRLLLMNQAAKELFGFTDKDSIPDKTLDEMYPPGVARQIMDKMRDSEKGGKGKLPVTKTTILNANGSKIPVEMTGAVIYDEIGRGIATMGIYNDLRERIDVEKKLKEAQVQLAQSEKMASLGQLAAGVAHEINNPLTGILFYSSLLKERLNENDSRREELGYVIEDANRCKEIVKNLLAYSRQTGSTKSVIQLNDLLEQSLALIRDQKVFGHIQVEKELSQEMMLINVDNSQIIQVIINLVINGVDAMEGKGILILRTYRDKAARKVFLEVSDTGCGISEENLTKIFDPFFTTKQQGKGTGLGLSTSIGLVTENGGNLHVKETNTQGTTFLVELPLYQLGEDIKH
ncbi:PAS domain S-box protein [Thermodesulfobacteriota bacterium]